MRKIINWLIVDNLFGIGLLVSSFLSVCRHMNFVFSFKGILATDSIYYKAKYQRHNILLLSLWVNKVSGKTKVSEEVDEYFWWKVTAGVVIAVTVVGLLIYFDSDAAGTSINAGAFLIQLENKKTLFQSLRHKHSTLEAQIICYTDSLLKISEKGQIGTPEYSAAIKIYADLNEEQRGIKASINRVLDELKRNGQNVDSLVRAIEEGDRRSRNAHERRRQQREAEVAIENAQQTQLNEVVAAAPIRYRIGSNVFEHAQQPGQTVAINRTGTGNRSTVPYINYKKQGAISFEVDIF